MKKLSIILALALVVMVSSVKAEGLLGRVVGEGDVDLSAMEDGGMLIKYTATIENLIDEPLAVFFVADSLDGDGNLTERLVMPYLGDIRQESLMIIPPYAAKSFIVTFVVASDVVERSVGGECYPLYIRASSVLEFLGNDFSI